MNYAKPLKKGDTVGIIAPSGPNRSIQIEKVKYYLNKLGYRVKIGKTCYLKYKGYLAGEDEIRALDLERMFLDKDVDAIMCIRGGYGATRILDLVDFSIIRDNPKKFIGFSDITALHICINQISNLVTYHGIMALSIEKWDEFSINSLLKALNFKDELIIENPPYEEIKSLTSGYSEGILVGGNLSLIISTLGTKYEIDTKDKILFIEEIGEYTYKIDKMLNQLYMSNKFKECRGVVFGDFTDCKASYKEDDEIMDILKEVANKINKPTLYNVKSGHCIPIVTLPLGAYCKIDCNNNTMKFIKK